MELGDRLTAGKHLVVRVSTPVRRPEPLDVGSKAHTIEFGTRVVLTEPGVDLQVSTGNGRADDLRGLDCSIELAGHQQRAVEFVRVGESIVQTLRLLTAEVGEP